MADIVEQLAQKSLEWIGGIPWSEITDDSFEDVQTELQYYVPLAEAMRAVFDFADQIDWTWDVPSADALLAWHGVREGILGEENALFSALASNVPALSSEQEVKIKLEIFRAFVSHAMATCMVGFENHRNLILQLGGADPELIVSNADKLHAMMQALRVLWDSGALNPLRKGAATSLGGIGLGAGPAIVVTPALAIVIGFTVVASIAMIGYILYTIKTLDQQGELAKDICREAARNPSSAAYRACRDAQKNLVDVADPFNLKESAQTIAIFGGITLLVIAGAYVLPDLMVGLKRARYR